MDGEQFCHQYSIACGPMPFKGFYYVTTWKVETFDFLFDSVDLYLWIFAGNRQHIAEKKEKIPAHLTDAQLDEIPY